MHNSLEHDIFLLYRHPPWIPQRIQLQSYQYYVCILPYNINQTYYYELIISLYNYILDSELNLPKHQSTH